MRRTTSIKQIRALSPKAKHRLIAWWVPQVGDRYYYQGRWGVIYNISNEQDVETYKTQGVPLLSMAQMIRFLGEIDSNWLEEISSFLRFEKRDKKFIKRLLDTTWEMVRRELER